MDRGACLTLPGVAGLALAPAPTIGLPSREPGDMQDRPVVVSAWGGQKGVLGGLGTAMERLVCSGLCGAADARYERICKAVVS